MDRAMDLRGQIAIYPRIMTVPFLKMNGLGNDFVVVEARAAPVALERRRRCARSPTGATGIGCDQLIADRAGEDAGADAFMRIWNADGEEVGACGNGTRCVGASADAGDRQRTRW